MGLGVLLGAWIARYLGTAGFGALNYATAFVALFGTFATLGLDGIVVRDLVRTGESGTTLGTAFALKLAGGVVTLAGAATAILIARPDDPHIFSLVVVISAATLFQSADVVDFWFQSRVASRYVVYARNAAFLVATGIRVVLVLTHAPLIAFAWAILLEAALAAGGLATAYASTREAAARWRVSIARSKELLAAGWPLILSGMAIMIYMKIDIVMLGSMIGDRGAGVYAAATRLSEVWYFIPVAVASSVAPAIAEAKATSETLYYERLRQLFSWMAGLAVAVAIPMTLLSGWIVTLFFGSAYAAAGHILAIHIWAGVFVALGVAQGLWDINEGLVRLSLYRTAGGAIVNIALNLLLIPRYEGLGSAIATVASYALSACVFNSLSARTRPIFHIQIQAMTFRGTATRGGRQ